MSSGRFLVGNKFNTSGFLEGELENNKNHGEQHSRDVLKRIKP